MASVPEPPPDAPEPSRASSSKKRGESKTNNNNIMASTSGNVTSPTGSGGSGSSGELANPTEVWMMGMLSESELFLPGSTEPSQFSLLDGMRIPAGPLVNALRAGTFQHPALALAGKDSASAGQGNNGAIPNSAPGARSGSLASVSSATEASSGAAAAAAAAGSNIVDRKEMLALTNDIKLVKDAFQSLRAVFQSHKDVGGATEAPSETLKVACHERLAEALTVIQNMMVRYPLLQCPPVIQGAAILIEMVRVPTSEADFYSALDALAMTFSTRVSGYLTGEITTEAFSYESLTPEQIDLLLMRHDQGVDHALSAARSWTKYAEDVLRYVEKRTQLELDWTKKMSKLCQSTRVSLKEESYLPFQSVYCTALDNDLELCANTQTVCSRLQSKGFVEPLTAKANKMKKVIKTLDGQWVKALKYMQDKVGNLNKATTNYQEKKEEYDRCREAVRIAEQGAEIGAMAENKVDKRKRNEEEAKSKIEDAEKTLNVCLQQANDHHARLMQIKSTLLRKIREMILDCDATMKTCTVNYFKNQLDLASGVPVQVQTLCEGSRRYEPGSQYMEFVRCRIGDQCSTLSFINPFGADHQSALQHALQYEELYGEHAARAAQGAQGPRKSSASVDGTDGFSGAGTYKVTGDRAAFASPSSGGTPTSTGSSQSPFPQSSSMGGVSTGSGGGASTWSPVAPEPCDTDSFDSREDSADRSKDTSPSASPRVKSSSSRGSMGPQASADNSEELGGVDSNSVTPTNMMARPPTAILLPHTSAKFTPSLAATTHRFKKIKAPSKCRECETYSYFESLTCQDCNISYHKKCLEMMAINCGHKRLPRKITTFGVDIGSYLLDAGCMIPPVVCRCVHDIEKRGMEVQGIYRVSGSARKVDRLCHAFDVATDLVELSDITPNVVANVLKKYMQKLPEPLIVFALYPEFIRLGKSCPSMTESGMAAPMVMTDDQIVQDFADLVRRLPRHHLNTLAFLMHHLRRVSMASDKNNMPASNLAIVFGPTLVRHPENKDNPNPSSLISLMDTEHQTRCIEILIMHAEEIFGDYESVLPRDYAKYASSAGGHNSAIGMLAQANSLGGGAGGGGGSKGRRTKGEFDFDGDLGAAVDSLERFSMDHADVDYPMALPPGVLPGHEDPSDSDADAEAIPSFLLPDGSAKTKKSPLLNRGGSECHIIKASLKGYTGLERVTREGLSTQDSLEASQKLSKQPSSEVMVPAVTSRKSVPHDASTSASVRHHRASDALFAKMGKAAKKHSLDEDYLSPPPSASGHPPLCERLSSDMAQALATSNSSGRAHGQLQHSATTTEALSGTSGSFTSLTQAGRSSSSTLTTTATSTTTSTLEESSSRDSVDSAVLRSSTSPGTGRTSLTIGIGGVPVTAQSFQPSSGSGRSSSLSEEQQQPPSATPSTSSVAEQRRKFLASSSATVSTDSHHFPPVAHSASTAAAISNLEENRVKIQVHGGVVTSGSSQSSAGAATSSARGITKQTSVDRG